MGGDGAKATEAKVIQPFSVAFDAAGDTLFVEMAGGERLRMIDTEGTLTTLAGTGKKGQTIGDGRQCAFNGMHDLAIAPDGTVYLADTFNNQIHKYDPKTKAVTAFAGTGKKGFAGDGGKATEAEFSQTICIALTVDGKTLYVADIGNKRVRAIDVKTGVVSTVAGTGKAGVPKDGELAKGQPLVDPRAITVDAKGNLYILERSGHALRVVDKDGKIRTVAGTGKAGKGGDGGPALKAPMNGPKYAAVDKDESVLIADTENHQIRRYRPETGTMELVAGSGKGKAFDTDPTKLQLARPHGVTVHPKTGAIYIADSDNGRIVKIVK
jgi:DNA-binding beta-propeller fold protein YncE